MNGSITVIQAVDEIVQAITSQITSLSSLETLLTDLGVDYSPEEFEASSVTLANDLGIGVSSAINILTDVVDSITNGDITIVEAADQILKTVTYVDIVALTATVTNLFNDSNTIEQTINAVAEGGRLRFVHFTTRTASGNEWLH